MAQPLTGIAAFVFGFSVGKKTRQYWSAREAMQAYPGIDVDVFLNGADDGVRGDNWRVRQLQTAAANP